MPTPILTHTDISRAVMLDGVGRALTEVRRQSRKQLGLGHPLRAIRLNMLHARIVDVVVQLVVEKADPGTDSIRLRLAAIEAGRMPHSGAAADHLGAAASKMAA